MEKKRDHKIDILRFIALVGIFIAHAGAPDWLMQFRSFDVPLMALLMGISFYLSNKDRDINYISYVINRVKRLVLPAWQFLTLFFLLFLVVSFFLGVPYFFNMRMIVSSYLLIEGIGYVWIIGVFITVALLNPLILQLSKRIKKNLTYFSGLTFVYLGYLALVSLKINMGETTASLYEHIILNTIAYGIVSAIGIRFNKLTKKEILMGAVTFLTLYTLFAIKNDFELTIIAKHPPTTYYLAYALGVSFLLNLILDIPKIFSLFDNKLVYFISKNSLWIYYWHIIPVYALSTVSELIPMVNDSFILKFLFLISVTALLTIFQQIAEEIIKKRN